MTAPYLALAYVRIAADSPAASADFAATRLGLQPAGQDGENFLMRVDQQGHRVAYFPRHGGDQSIGIELADAGALDTAAQALASNGFAFRPASTEECRQRQVRAALLTRDASGNAIDFVLAPRQNARRCFPPRDSGVTGLANLALRSAEIDRDTLFWTSILGATVTDRVGDISYLGFDRQHHRIVVHPSDRAGLLYVCFAVESLDHVMQNHHFLADHQVRILQGPGRQPASGQVFVHIEGPDGMIYGYGHGMAELDPRSHRPRQFAAENASLCSWGSACDAVPELRFAPAETAEYRPIAGRTAP